MQYQIKRCTAPCVDYISPQEYGQSVDDAMRFLQGKSQLIISELSERMEQAVAALNFEEAALLRDQIKNLRLVQEQQGMVQLRGDADVIVIEAKPGFACIQCATIREGQVVASQSFFPTVPQQPLDEAEQLWQQIFEAFISFYYLDMPSRIPQLVITNQPLNDKTALEEILTQYRGKSCTLQINPRGVKTRWLDFAVNNLRIAVAEYISTHSTIRSRYAALEEYLGLSKRLHGWSVLI